MTEALGEDQRAVDDARARGQLLSVAVGLGVFGLSTYGYLGLAGQALGVAAFAPLSVLWSLLNAVGIGLFLPFEQELGRRTAERRAAGQGNRPVVRRALAAVGIVLAAVTVIGAAGYGAWSRSLFADRAELVPIMLFALAGMAASYVARGLLSGNGEFGHYGAQLGLDGVLRVVAAAALYLTGTTSLVAWGLVLVVVPVLAVLFTTPRPASLVSDGPDLPVRVAAVALGTLIAASLLSQGLANAGPVIVQLLADESEKVASGHFLAALVIARVPLFAFAAVQAVLLPGLARAVGTGDVAAFRRRSDLVGWATFAIGALGTLAVWLLGAELVPLLFGDEFGTSRGVITLIAASGAAFMLAQAAAQALLALGAERLVVGGWAAGLLALVLACLWQGPISERAAVALLAGAVVALAVLAVGLVRAYRSWTVALAGAQDA